MIRQYLPVVVACLAASACGKSTKESVAEAKVGETNQEPKTAQPTIPPVKAAARGPEHPVYSLVDNRLSAHLTRGGGLVVDAGSAAFAKYTRIGNVMKGAKKAWDLRQNEGEIKVAKLTGKTGTVFVPLTAAEAGRATVRIRAFAADKQALSVRVNDNKDINSSLDAGWSTVEVSVPAGQLKEGENSIALFGKKSGIEVAWMQIGGQTPVGDDGGLKFFDPGTKSLVLPKDGGMTWFAAIPDKAAPRTW